MYFLPGIVYFEISADKPERAVKFYGKTFGWKIVKWEGPIDYRLITTGKDEARANLRVNSYDLISSCRGVQCRSD